MNFSHCSARLIKPFLPCFVRMKYVKPVPTHFKRLLTAMYTHIASVEAMAETAITTRVTPPFLLPKCLTEKSKYFPEHIRRYINSTPIHYQIVLRGDKMGCTVNVSVFQRMSKKELKTLHEQLEHVFIWITLCKRFASTKTCAETVTVHIFLTPFEKHMPSSDMPSSSNVILGPEQVNSAFTLDCAQNGEIVIYRAEEWFKVLIHETFHAFGLDIGHDAARVTDHLQSLFQIKCDFGAAAAEGYAETFARIWTCAFCSFRASQHNITHFLLYMELCLQLERLFAIFQCHKILQYMGLTYKDILRKKTTIGGDQLLYKEDTNVFAYYILTAVLLNDYPAFMLWCADNNDNLVQFARGNDQAMRSLNHFIDNQLKEPLPPPIPCAATRRLHTTSRMSLL